MTIIRIGDGRSPSGKILDRKTTWFRLEEKEDAIREAMKTNKKIYISRNNSKYFEISLDTLELL